MANPIWKSSNSSLDNLGTVVEGVYFEAPLDAYDPNGGSVSYKFLAGTLPPGIRINQTGLVQGVPVLNDVANETRTFEFSIRATDQNGFVSDKTFVLTIANVSPPVIVPRVNNLGQIFDGEFYSLQLQATELNPYANLTWSLTSGTLPPGVTLGSGGLLSGFVLPVLSTPTSGQGYNINPYNEFAYENSPIYQNNNYQFTIKVFDGANYDSLTYKLYVVAKSHYSADSVYSTIDNTFLTIDQDNRYIPIMLTPSQALPEVRSNSKFAYQFQAIDPNGQQISYSLATGGGAGFDQGGSQGFDTTGFDQENLSVPPGLSMDSTTGWLSGTIGSQVQALQTYVFQVYAYETTNVTNTSVPIKYTMNVLGDITNNMTWTTNANLGIIDNGTISQLSVSAVNNAGKSLVYSLVSDGGSLPQGLELQNSGLIVGRTSFDFFSLDRSNAAITSNTTIDGHISNFDNTYKFIVQATTTDGTASSQQTFTILVNNYNLTPYENVYLKALPTVDQRNLFLSIVNNTDIFPNSLIYRPSDPWFGRARDIRSLFLAGLAPTAVNDYIASLGTNTYAKRINFSNIKTAQAVDANFNVKYEVVYLELEDTAMYKGNSPADRIYDAAIGKYVYPNSFKNMSSVITAQTGYANRGAIPDWMSSPQANKKQLGFTHAIVLAYTVPGASNLIAYRLKANGIAFDQVNFVADRYDLDNSLSANYNISSGTFVLGRETTFDRIQSAGTVTTSATYGVTGLAFSQINNQSVAAIQALGGIDGTRNFASGETLIFLQQENFGAAAGAYDGWTNNGTLISGYNEYVHSAKIASGTTGFPANATVGQTAVVNNVYYQFTADYDNSGNVVDTVWKVANLRANVWQINISSNNIVTLTPVIFQRKLGTGTASSWILSSILTADRVQINRGTHIDTIVYYNPIIGGGNSVPTYQLVTTHLANTVFSISSTTSVQNHGSSTIFDGYGTRFINNRDVYANPEVSDSWLKFPVTGPLLT